MPRQAAVLLPRPPLLSSPAAWPSRTPCDQPTAPKATRGGSDIRVAQGQWPFGKQHPGKTSRLLRRRRTFASSQTRPRPCCYGPNPRTVARSKPGGGAGDGAHSPRTEQPTPTRPIHTFGHFAPQVPAPRSKRHPNRCRRYGVSVNLPSSNQSKPFLPHVPDQRAVLEKPLIQCGTHTPSRTKTIQLLRRHRRN